MEEGEIRKVDLDENEVECSILEMETKYDETYYMYVDFSESNQDTTGFVFDVKCLDCTHSNDIQNVPTTNTIPEPSSFIKECASDDDCSWLDVISAKSLLEGDADGDYAGGSVDDHLSNSVIAMDSSGMIVAYGAEMADNEKTGSENVGCVKIYQRTNDKPTIWRPLGQTIMGDHENHNLGTAVALSADGMTIVIGAPNFGVNNKGVYSKFGHARVYQYNDTISTWVQLGDDVDVGTSNEMIGFDVDINDNGTIVAIGSRSVSNKRGRVRVFEWIHDEATWDQMGDDINGDQTESSDGRSISLSSNGLILAVGAPHYDDLDKTEERDHGRVRIFQFGSATWELMGNPIIGNAGSLFGFSVDLSADGTIVAVGARWDSSDDQVSNGSASVYTFNDTTKQWTLLSSRVIGDQLFEQLGVSVQLSSNGQILATGALGSKPTDFLPWVGGNYVRVYILDNESKGLPVWLDMGDRIDGEKGSRSGESIAISASGMTLAVGAALASNSRDSNVLSGNVRVYDFKELT